MKVVFVSSEAVPFVKTGGLADVAGALPRALAARGIDVALFLPLYGRLRSADLDIGSTGMRIRVPVGGVQVTGTLYRSEVSGNGFPVYLVSQNDYFDRDGLYGTGDGDYPDNAERFSFFCRAVLAALDRLGVSPDILHVNDWQTAMIPVYARTSAKAAGKMRPRILLTVHNMAYQGRFPVETYPLLGLDWQYFNWRELEFYNMVNFLKGGLVFSDAVNTVSKRYAEEITTPAFGEGLEGVLKDRRDVLFGIVNGVDYQVWDPTSDILIPANYSFSDLSGKKACKAALQREMGLAVDASTPLIGMIGRLADQKGFDIFADAVAYLMQMKLQVVVLGTGQQRYHRLLTGVAAANSQKMAVRLTFDNALAHRIEAGADMFLMPSRFEPCGLNQLYSLRYGTVPVVHATGGLADTVVDYASGGRGSAAANGFSFSGYGAFDLQDALRRALGLYRRRDRWRRLQIAGMKQDWSWDRSAGEYVGLYEMLMER
ncbi:MAG: glycogen synthase GlgA [Planctomycetes bacterium]|nr:glycogen synthase GlgA [Planctomycetota bacterium]